MLKKLNEFRMKIEQGTDALLQGTHNHYSCYLPKDIGWVSSFIFKLFFSGIDIRKEQIAVLEQLPKDAVIVYAGKYKSYFEYFFTIRATNKTACLLRKSALITKC